MCKQMYQHKSHHGFIFMCEQMYQHKSLKYKVCIDGGKESFGRLTAARVGDAGTNQHTSDRVAPPGSEPGPGNSGTHERAGHDSPSAAALSCTRHTCHNAPQRSGGQDKAADGPNGQLLLQ